MSLKAELEAIRELVGGEVCHSTSGVNCELIEDPQASEGDPWRRRCRAQVESDQAHDRLTALIEASAGDGAGGCVIQLIHAVTDKGLAGPKCGKPAVVCTEHYEQYVLDCVKSVAQVLRLEKFIDSLKADSAGDGAGVWCCEGCGAIVEPDRDGRGRPIGQHSRMEADEALSCGPVSFRGADTRKALEDVITEAADQLENGARPHDCVGFDCAGCPAATVAGMLRAAIEAEESSR